MDIVVAFDSGTKEYKFYEPTTDTLLISGSIWEGFVELNLFLASSGLISGGHCILDTPDISYHIDSQTFRSMVESNVGLLKRLQTADTSEFKTSSDRFGASQSSFGKSTLFSKKEGFGSKEFGGKKSNFAKSNKKWKN
jgi:hypothetical protein